MSNRLSGETSLYLKEHAENPVDWYPWGDEAFERARTEDKPIFLSVGYSSCHWCHVMAKESFEDEKIAELLNRHFISIKVDREERPDIDSIYMRACQAFTGSGGWPMSIFMTADGKPFFAGTYFPKFTRGRMLGFHELLDGLSRAWKNDREGLLGQASRIVAHIGEKTKGARPADTEVAERAVEIFEHIYDKKHGGFGRAPKFPSPHNLIFLLEYYKRFKKKECLSMAEYTLIQMYRGGMFDHIGYGFCRYSTDKSFLVPHFEKMLYDNAMLILAYSRAYRVTGKEIYLDIAKKTAEFVLSEMTSPEGAFFSATDADSGGEEGIFYLFDKDEIISLLGEADGEGFCRRFGITERGNFEGRNIPNLLGSNPEDSSFDVYLSKLREYRKGRCDLRIDKKVLTFPSSLMIAALCELYRASKNKSYLEAAERAASFIEKNLSDEDRLFVSYLDGERGVGGFLDDYAGYIFALLSLYDATLNVDYLTRAECLCSSAISLFSDPEGGFYMYAEDSERLILRPKETYDGAVPSGNSLMAYCLVRLSLLTENDEYEEAAKRQLDFLMSAASDYPSGYTMFLTALLEYFHPKMKLTVVPGEDFDKQALALSVPQGTYVTVLEQQTENFRLKNGKTTYYLCRDKTCLPPENDLEKLIRASNN